MACASQIVDKFTRVCQFLLLCFPKLSDRPQAPFGLAALTHKAFPRSRKVPAVS